MNFTDLYNPTLFAMALAGLLLLLQLIVADLTAIRAGHKAGYPIPADSGTFLFRAARAHANTNESISVFVLFATVAILASADPRWLNALSWAYLACRAGHMAAYYAGLKLPRSIIFGVSLAVLLGLFATALQGLLGQGVA